MHRRRFTSLAAASAAALPWAGRARAADTLKVGFIYVGPVGDFGWSYQHDVARQAAEAHFGGRVTTTKVESVPEGPDAEKVLDELADSGHGLIFTTSFGYMNATIKAARRHPDVYFEHATGYKRAKNVSTYDIRFYEARYVEGVIAGRISKTGLAGYVGAVPVPEVVQGINAYLLGMRSVNPRARVKFIMVDSWYEPPKEGDAARAMIDQGCDVIAQHTDSPAALQAAASRGAHAFGEATDMIKFAPKAELSAGLDTWAPYYIKRIGDVLAGTWTSTDVWGGFNTGMLSMAPFTNMPADVAAQAQATVDAISAGKTRVFAGPITDQAGTLRVPAGQVLDDASLLSLQWLASGVDGTLA
jgi:simple sugar transport system substrate-binding protein